MMCESKIFFNFFERNVFEHIIFLNTSGADFFIWIVIYQKILRVLLFNGFYSLFWRGRFADSTLLFNSGVNVPHLKKPWKTAYLLTFFRLWVLGGVSEQYTLKNTAQLEITSYIP